MINWDFCKKILLFSVIFCLTLCSLFIFKKVFYINSDYLFYIQRSVYETLNALRSARIDIQHSAVDYALDCMYYNEYCFYLRPNTEAFIQSRIEYQKGLKALLDALNFNQFAYSEEELRFFTAFYEHYLKIIELNNDLIKNKKL